MCETDNENQSATTSLLKYLYTFIGLKSIIKINITQDIETIYSIIMHVNLVTLDNTIIYYIL